MKRIEQAFDAAAERYAESGVNVDKAIARLLSIPISIHVGRAMMLSVLRLTIIRSEAA